MPTARPPAGDQLPFRPVPEDRWQRAKLMLILREALL